MNGLFKGMTYPLLGQAAINALVFGVESMVYGRLNKTESPSVKSSILAGMCAGTVQTVIACPMELVKIKLQNQSIGQPHISWTMMKLGRRRSIPKNELFKGYRGPLELTLDILHKDGIRGMFRGWWLTLFREVPQYGIYFGTYTWIRIKFAAITNTSPENLSVLHLSLAGGITGVITWSWYPIDVIKSRFQYDGVINDKRMKYKGIMDCIRKSYKSEGMGVFVRGFQPTLINGFFNGLATFPVFTLTLQLLNSKHNI